MTERHVARRVRFTLQGSQYELTREVVDQRLDGVVPEPVYKHAVRINDTWYPVMQAFEVAIGMTRRAFISHTARRHLADLGYEVHGQIESREGVAPRPAGSPPTPPRPDPAESTIARHADESWYTESNVQAAVVTALASQGWRILSVANTASKEHGLDILAERSGETVGVEAKGFPARGYADPARASEVKPTQPSTQAGHWYAQAILAAMRLRSKRPELTAVIALPDFPRYRNLYDETRGSLDAAGISLWWVTADREVAM